MGLSLHEVQGFCMSPFLKDGQRVLVRKTAGPELRPGDLLLYRGEGGLHCHRLLRKERRNGRWVFHCRADTELSCGHAVDESRAEGKVVAVIDEGRIVSLETPFRRWLAVLILSVLSPLWALLQGLRRSAGRRRAKPGADA